ncbi:helix-turn-helix domain-containing protein [Aneurinibacillus thermoaerophilus]|uniref:helix-turn-helix domain-containing protein n=1 Tax=Aneurinibacillus thermoaerophilus TaxID=143495 RepID=UPI002E1D6492|nr:helix-turn-helix domain-containing protein [Aneurinibacillus thermoaerophilus]
MSHLGERLRKARERANLKQIQVYERTKINNKTLSRYERGGSEPDIETLKTLAELYNVSLEWLLTGETNESNQKNQAESHSFAKRLRKHRESCNLSIEDLAEKVGLTPHTIEKFENGRSDTPGQKTLDKLSDALGVTRDYLLGYTDNPKGYGSGVYANDPTDLKEIFEKQGPLMYDGVPLSEEQKEKLALLMRQAYFIVKEENKKEAARRRKKIED